MKIDRLIGILSVLLQRERVTASQLAEEFEVARRTIDRDVEDLNRAGIPVAAQRGKGGGLYIMEGYALDKTLLTSTDMLAILTGLKSLDSVEGTNRYRQLMNKLSEDGGKEADSMIIDLSMWSKDALAPKIELFRTAIEKNETVRFEYISPDGTSKREIEPYRLIYQWSSWYVWGWCMQRQDYRMFRLSRVVDPEATGTVFESRTIPEYSSDKLRHTRGGLSVTVRFDKTMKWRLADDFGAENLTESDGGFVHTFNWSDTSSLFSYILTFGDKAEILSPKKLRQEFAEFTEKILAKYLLEVRS
ncbi:MAG: YafY family transcriptional regulator [Ruminococcus sp.]|nr:YafY family transcriptional regulator [Ruminococcus sp.]